MNITGMMYIMVFMPGMLIGHNVAIGDHLTGFAIDGSPTDCVFFGVRIFGGERPFDLVVSGINHGPNIGSTYNYSGTVGAAFEALLPAVTEDSANSVVIIRLRGRDDVGATLIDVLVKPYCKTYMQHAADEIRAKVPDAEVVLRDGWDHFPMIEQPEEYAREIVAIARRLAPAD